MSNPKFSRKCTSLEFFIRPKYRFPVILYPDSGFQSEIDMNFEIQTKTWQGVNKSDGSFILTSYKRYICNNEYIAW